REPGHEAEPRDQRGVEPSRGGTGELGEQARDKARQPDTLMGRRGESPAGAAALERCPAAHAVSPGRRLLAAARTGHPRLGLRSGRDAGTAAGGLALCGAAAAEANDEGVHIGGRAAALVREAGLELVDVPRVETVLE